MMKPLILQFAEKVDSEDSVFPELEYSLELQLSVLKGTKTPAFDISNLTVKTFTKAGNEVPDDARANYCSQFTMTRSAANNEISDEDSPVKALNRLMFTRTKTFTNTEASDDDPSKPLYQISAPQTQTRQNKEETDVID